MEFKAEVKKGAGRGKKIGFPTINLLVPADFSLPTGVYCGQVLLAKKWIKAIFHWGVNHTFAAKSPTFEVHLIDFDGRFEASELRVKVGAYLRPSRKFASASDLAKQIAIDIEDCLLLRET